MLEWIDLDPNLAVMACNTIKGWKTCLNLGVIHKTAHLVTGAHIY